MIVVVGVSEPSAARANCYGAGPSQCYSVADDRRWAAQYAVTRSQPAISRSGNGEWSVSISSVS